LVSATWAVTANHCLDAGFTQARFGSLDNSNGGELVEIAETVPGPNGSDIALVRLASPVGGAPVTIASASPAPGAGITLLGWGQTVSERGDGPPSAVLKELDTTVVEDSACSEQGNTIDGPTELCIQSSPDQTACFGDSGGPAIFNGALIGAASRGSENCGDANAVYVDVTAFASWVQEKIGGTGPTDPPVTSSPAGSPGQTDAPGQTYSPGPTGSGFPERGAWPEDWQRPRW
jgi:secreted trypsin-like serine protease